MTPYHPAATTEQGICTATRRDGKPCRARALPGKSHCVFHDPEHTDACTRGRKRGGIRARRYGGIGKESDNSQHPNAAKIDLVEGSEPDVLRILQTLLSGLLSGRVPTKHVNAAAILLNTALRAMQQQREASPHGTEPITIDLQLTTLMPDGTTKPLDLTKF
jgi:hypothetical protein